jgi:hypothetical protein
MKSTRGSVIGAVILGAACIASSAQAAVVSDFATDFSTASSTSGAWQYGSAATLGGSFVLDTVTTLYGAGGDVVAWSPAGTYWPTIALNTSATQVNFGGGDAVHLASKQGLLHPGPNGEFAVVRLQVTSTFTGKLDVEFAGVDTLGTSTDVHILLNGVSLYSGLINGYGQLQSFNQNQALQAGDVLEFAVGRGANGSYVDDSTGFRATLSTLTQSVPEPSAPALLAAGLLVMAAARQYRKR